MLIININSNNVTLPAGIGEGDSGACIQLLHNHLGAPGGPYSTDVIHIEQDKLFNVTLNDLFRVWAGSPNVQGPRPVIFNQNQVFNYSTGGGNELRMYVNGQRSTAYGTLVLQDHQIIVIAYGNYSPAEWSAYQTMSGKPWPYSGY
jgi:hypothetical protein